MVAYFALGAFALLSSGCTATGADLAAERAASGCLCVASKCAAVVSASGHGTQGADAAIRQLDLKQK